MFLLYRMDRAIKIFRWYDIALIKVSTAAATLFMAKLWPVWLTMPWYGYIMVAFVAAILPLRKIIISSF